MAVALDAAFLQAVSRILGLGIEAEIQKPGTLCGRRDAMHRVAHGGVGHQVTANTSANIRALPKVNNWTPDRRRIEPR